jgi:hypothetical protein
MKQQAERNRQKQTVMKPAVKYIAIKLTVVTEHP